MITGYLKGRFMEFKSPNAPCIGINVSSRLISLSTRSCAKTNSKRFICWFCSLEGWTFHLDYWYLKGQIIKFNIPILGFILFWVNRSLPPCNIGHFWFSPRKIFLFWFTPLIGQTKTNFFFQEIFVFVWPIKGVNQNKNILQGVNQKKYFTGGKTRNGLYYRGVKTY